MQDFYKNHPVRIKYVNFYNKQSKSSIYKTTSSVNLAVGLAKQGMKVIATDLDPQGSLSISLGLKIQKNERKLCLTN